MKIIKFLERHYLILFILILALLLRFYKLGSIPPHLTPDEASLGYNAYSILKTGRDEHGSLLPIIFKSFGDYKPGLYIYVTVPFVALFGLNEFSVRFPSALLGVLSVFLLYLIVQEVFKKKPRLKFVAAFFLAISPWHMYFSRGAWEINLSLTLTLLGIYFFLKALREGRYLSFSALSFALTLLAYQGAKLSTSIVLLLLLVFNLKKFLKISKPTVALAIFVGAIISIPILLSLFNGQTGRLTVFSIFNNPRPSDYLVQTLNQDNEQVNSVSYYLFHSEWFNFLRGILGRWFNHFSGRFLFFEGDFSNPRHSAPYSGMLSVFDLPILVIGLFVALRGKLKGFSGLTLLWLIVSPLPAILSRDQVHAVRSFNMVIPLTLLLSLGAFEVFQRLKNKLVLFGIILIYTLGYLYYLDAYFIHLPKLNSKYWEYGYKQAVNIVTPIAKNYKDVIFQQSYSQPYIYFLFYNKYDPQEYQSKSNENYVPSSYGDVGQVEALDGITFRGIDWQILRGKSGTLVIGDRERIPAVDSREGVEFHVIADIKYLDNQNTALRVIEIK